MCVFEYSNKHHSMWSDNDCCLLLSYRSVQGPLCPFPLWWMNPWLSWHLSMCSIALPWRWAQMPSRWPIQSGLRSYLDYHMSAPSLCISTVQWSISVGFFVCPSSLMMGWCVLVNRAVHGRVMYTPTLCRKHTESKTAKTKYCNWLFTRHAALVLFILGLGVSEKYWP